MNDLECLADEYSDFFKEAYGYRPRMDTSAWTAEDFAAEFARLGEICEENRKAEAAAEQEAVLTLEARILKLIDMGAADRAAAIRWLADAEEVNGDMNYLCYKLGLPYHYFA